MSARRANVKGFTLVEVVVAVTISGLALTAGAGAVATLVDARLESSERLQAVAEAANDRRTLIDMISSALPGTPATPHPFQAMDRTVNGLPDDELQFDVPHAQPFLDGPGTVRIFIDRTSRDEADGLMVEILPEGEAEVLRVSLVPGAVSLDAEYLPPDPGAGVWLRGWISMVQLPAAVRLNIRGGEGEAPILLGLPVLVPLGPAA